MNFFENTRKPQGFGGKLMAKMMNSGHAKLSQWGFSNISAKPDAEVLDVGCGGGANIAVWLDRCSWLLYKSDGADERARGGVGGRLMHKKRKVSLTITGGTG